MALVIDPNIAFRECHGYKLDDEFLLYSAGTIGMLSDSQEKLCKSIKVLKSQEVPFGLMKRWKFFKEASSKCSLEVSQKYPKGQRFLPFLSCMSVKAKEMGVKL